MTLYKWSQTASADANADPAPMLELLSGIHQALGLPPPVIPVLPPDPFRDQLEAVLEARPAVFSFTFGIPDSDAFRLLRARGIAILGTATTAAEARLLVVRARLDECGRGLGIGSGRGAGVGGERGALAGELLHLPASWQGSGREG